MIARPNCLTRRPEFATPNSRGPWQIVQNSCPGVQRAGSGDPMAADALSDVLRTVRLTGAVFFEVAATEPCVAESAPRDIILPKVLPGADHLIAYHVVTMGRCFGMLIDGQPIALEAGEVIVFTHGDPHVMSSSPGMRADPPSAAMLDDATAERLPFVVS